MGVLLVDNEVCCLNRAIMIENGTSVDYMARALAIGDFALAAISLVYQYLKDQRRMKVRAENARRFEAGEYLDTSLSVVAFNSGHRSISIHGFSLNFDDGSVLGTGAIYVPDSDGHYGRMERTSDSDELGCLLEDGESTQVYFGYQRIIDFMLGLDEAVKLDGIYAYDAACERHKAKVPKHLREKINNLRSS